MKLRIRPVELAADRQELLDILQRNLPDVSHRQRLSWLYEKNPAGPANSWFLCDADGAAVGVTSLFARAVWLDGKQAVCGQVGDFGVDKQFRSLGPAIALQRATFEPVVRKSLAFCYDCPPHDRGMAMFERLGLKENCRMHVYVNPIRADRQLGRILGKTAGVVAGKVVNPILAMKRRRTTSAGLEFAMHHGEFGPEFSALDQDVKDDSSVRNRRSAVDLNWRFRQNPAAEFEVLTARRHGELLAYIVFTILEEDAFVFDFFGRELDVAGLSLLQELGGLMSGRPVQTLRALVASNCSYVPIFRDAGFSLRGDAVRVVAFSSSPDRHLSDMHWMFQHADIMA